MLKPIDYKLKICSNFRFR